MPSKPPKQNGATTATNSDGGGTGRESSLLPVDGLMALDADEYRKAKAAGLTKETEGDLRRLSQVDRFEEAQAKTAEA